MFHPVQLKRKNPLRPATFKCSDDGSKLRMIEPPPAISPRDAQARKVRHGKDYCKIQNGMATYNITMSAKDFRQTIESVRLLDWPSAPIVAFENEDRHAKDGLAPESLQVAPVVRQDRCSTQNPQDR